MVNTIIPFFARGIIIWRKILNSEAPISTTALLDGTPTIIQTETFITEDAGTYTLEPGVYQINYSARTVEEAGDAVALSLLINGAEDPVSVLEANTGEDYLSKTINYSFDATSTVALQITATGAGNQLAENFSFNITKLN